MAERENVHCELQQIVEPLSVELADLSRTPRGHSEKASSEDELVDMARSANDDVLTLGSRLRLVTRLPRPVSFTVTTDQFADDDVLSVDVSFEALPRVLVRRPKTDWLDVTECLLTSVDD